MDVRLAGAQGERQGDGAARPARVESLPAEPLLRILLAGVAIAAGITGIVLLTFPSATHRYFSWSLAPPSLAALMGGAYLASMAVFAVALRASWTEVRGLVAATLAFSLPILAVTFAHIGAFGARWQALAWVLLFVGSPVAFGAVLYLHRGRVAPAGPPLPGWARIVSALLAVGFLVLAVAIWVDPIGATRWLPFDPQPLGARVLGCWASFLGFLCAWAAVRNRWTEARIPLLAVAAFSAGGLVAGLRSLVAGFQPSDAWGGYLGGLAALLVVTALLAVVSGRSSGRSTVT